MTALANLNFSQSAIGKWTIVLGGFIVLTFIFFALTASFFVG